MPPKAKFSKEQIIEVALNLVRQNGIESISARVLANELHTSVCPIFTLFKDMAEVEEGIKNAAKAVYKSYVKRGLEEEIAFKGVGTQYILFAIKEPKLFQLLFMTEQQQRPSVDNVLPIIDESYDAILASAKDGYSLTLEQAEKLYRHLWIYTHGIAALCSTNTCSFTAQEISKMMSEVFVSILKNIKEEK